MKNLTTELPKSPGIYRMKDREGRILYVGKAKDLRQRVKTYFQKDYAHSTRTRKLLEHTADIDFIETDSELEALLLETNLIKHLRPRYNILMKDDKSYVYIKVDLDEDFPRIRAVRQRTLEKTGDFGRQAKYFGPKLASTKVYETLRILKKLFPFRHCQLDIKWKKPAPSSDASAVAENLILSPNKNLVEITNRVIDFPCLDYFIKRCPGPCIGAIAPEEYKKIVQQIVEFLEGKNDALEQTLKTQMMEAASQKLFEKAARLRDKLFALQTITEKQKITDLQRRDTDVINFSADLGRVYFTVLMIRRGKLLGQENFALDALEMTEKDAPIDLKEVLQAFLTQYYEKAADIPKEILIPDELEDRDILENWLGKKRGNRVTLTFPKKGEKNQLLELSLKNAVSFGKQFRIKWLAQQRGETALARLAQVLGMKEKPIHRIEGFDISHLGGRETVGSMVVFEKGAAKSSDYRHFKMRTVEGKPDDYRSMEEVLMRRLKYLAKPEDLAVKKASKKDAAFIEKLLGDPLKQPALILLKEKQPVGAARVAELKKGIFEIEAMELQPDHSGDRLSYAFLDRLIKRAKNRRARFYVSAEENAKNDYLQFGFIEPLRIPPEVARRKKKKQSGPQYTVLAFYKGAKKTADPSFTAKPDLMVIDGGKGQLSTALLALKRLQLEIPAIALAKRLEEIYLPGEKAPLLLEEGDEALKLLQRIRDESHRFAITFQRNLHRKGLLEK